MLQKDSAVAFVNGLQKAPADPVSKQKRWADTRNIQAASAVYIPNAFMADDTSEELGDFQLKEDKECRLGAEKEKARLVWNVERRCFLGQASNSA